jgi:DNA-binding MarR family transcriptional regulator
MHCGSILDWVTQVERDWIDQVVERWSALQLGLPVDAYHVTGRISRIAARIAQREDEVFARYGLTRGDVGVLSALRISPPPHTLSPTQLFRGLMLSSAGMTKRLDRLEQRGLIKRNPDPNDRRGVTIHLTESGRRLVARAVAENTKNEATLLTGLSGKDRRALADLLRAVLSTAEPAAGG